MMRIFPVLQLVAFGHGLVIIDASVSKSTEAETKGEVASVLSSLEQSLQDLSQRITQKKDSLYENVEETYDNTASWASSTVKEVEEDVSHAYSGFKGWATSTVSHAKDYGEEDRSESLNTLDIKDYSLPHRGGHHHDHHKPNKTVFELIAGNRYTTKLADLISQDHDLIDLLNGTSANLTVFAPTDRALDRLSKRHGKPSKEQIKKFLSYHVSNEFYPAGRILATRTIPTLLDEPVLGKGNPQRLATEVSLKGLTINFYSRVVAVNIFGTNGVIHGIDAPLFPPPTAFEILNFLPSEFSTLLLGLSKTGLDKLLNSTGHHAGTLFAPSNYAFSKLGPRLSGFLFSKYGLKYLKAILEYHVVPSCSFYSDALYNTTNSSTSKGSPPKGIFHVDLPTLLKGRELSIDVARYGRLIEIKINGFYRVSVSDGIAKDGVIHLLQEVLVPPKKIGDAPVSLNEKMAVEELKARLAPFVDDDDPSEDIEILLGSIHSHGRTAFEPATQMIEL